MAKWRRLTVTEPNKLLEDFYTRVYEVDLPFHGHGDQNHFENEREIVDEQLLDGESREDEPDDICRLKQLTQKFLKANENLIMVMLPFHENRNVCATRTYLTIPSIKNYQANKAEILFGRTKEKIVWNGPPRRYHLK